MFGYLAAAPLKTRWCELGLSVWPKKPSTAPASNKAQIGAGAFSADIPTLWNVRFGHFAG
jgi:hypothetical protein